MTFEEYKAQYPISEDLNGFLTEEEIDTMILISYCNDYDNFSCDPDDF